MENIQIIKAKYRHRFVAVLYAVSFFFVLFCLCYPQKCVSKQQFTTTYKQDAYQINRLPEVLSDRPRMLLRALPWKHGPDLKTLRQWSKNGPIKNFLRRKPWNPKPGFESGFRYLLTGEEKYVRPIIEMMKSKKNYWPGRLYGLAVLYDWMFNHPSFSEKEKHIVELKMVSWAEQAIKHGQKYHDMWSHFGYRPILDVAAAGLSLSGRKKEAIRYMAMARGYMEKTFFPGWRNNSGAWQGGWDYYRQGASNLFKLIAIWSSATNEDLFELIASDGGDWVRDHMYYLMYAKYPDHSPMDTSGFGRTPDQKGGTQTLLLLARAYQDRNAQAHLRWRNQWGWRLGIDQYLYWFPADSKQENKMSSLPLTKAWGKQGLGYVQMRSGWKPGDTIIDFKCGDYFWSHHYENENAFTIYRKGRLAIQSGIYSGAYWGDHVLQYYRPTIGSNSILVIQPGETTWVPPKLAKKYNVQNEKGYIANFGGQRSCYIHPVVGSAETCFTWEKYLYRKHNDHHFETGDITAYEVASRYAYTMGDATLAYNTPKYTFPRNTPKLDLFTRQMVFLDKKYILMFDRVQSLKPSYEKRWLLHSVGEPKIEGTLLNKEVPNHIETYSAGNVIIENEGGRLFCKTLFKNEFKVRKVGGGARISDIKPASSNLGKANLNGRIKGQYKRVSPFIATEQAIVENWEIKFIDPVTFTIKGSITGDDGKGSLAGKKNKRFISKSGRIFIPKKQWNGTPSKGDTFTFSVLSPSHRFWADGKNHPPPRAKGLVKQFGEGTPLDPGNWRIEVIPKSGSKYNYFLHFLYPCDRNPSGVSPMVRDVESSNGVFKGAAVKDWIVLFQNSKPFKEKTEYRVEQPGKKNHLLLGLQPVKQYAITLKPPGRDDTTKVVTASENGTLSFVSDGSTHVEIAMKRL